MKSNPKISMFAAETEDAKRSLESLISIYGNCLPEEADYILVLGGDGTMLETLHDTMELGKPVYGMNRGSIGFLLNPYSPDDLITRLEQAQSVTIHPLRMTAITKDGKEHEALAFNEVSLFRQTRYAAKMSITVDGVVRISEMISDGILVSTPAGSTAYNLSAHGPIIPLSSDTLAMTPISPFRPRRWRGALLPSSASIRIETLESDKRPVSVAADFIEVNDVICLEIHEAKTVAGTLMFDPDHGLEERIIKEQFLV